MTELDPEIVDDLFHGCAFAAFVDEARATGGRPDMEATRRRAFQYYEEELKRKNGLAVADAPAASSRHAPIR